MANEGLRLSEAGWAELRRRESGLVDRRLLESAPFQPQQRAQ